MIAVLQQTIQLADAIRRKLVIIGGSTCRIPIVSSACCVSRCQYDSVVRSEPTDGCHIYPNHPTLDEMLSKVADQYEMQVDIAVDSISSLIEPMMMSFLGILIGGMIIAMYLPIFILGSAM